MMTPSVHSTHVSTTHSFSKTYTPTITLVPGVGVQNDCHAGKTTRHRSQATANPTAPNLRQVHLIPYELFRDLSAQSLSVQPGELGENITTWGIDLLALSKGTYLYFGAGNDVPIVQVTGLRWPGQGIEKHKRGLGEKLLVRGSSGEVKSKCGVMGVVVRGGPVKAGDAIRAVEPQGTKVALEPV